MAGYDPLEGTYDQGYGEGYRDGRRESDAAIETLRATLESVRPFVSMAKSLTLATRRPRGGAAGLRCDGPIGPDIAQNVVQGGLNIALLITRHDAFDMAEQDAKPVTCTHCRDTHRMQLGDREVMCTHCPLPCSKCASRASNNPSGPYCKTTPCRCACHAAARAQTSG